MLALCPPPSRTVPRPVLGQGRTLFSRELWLFSVIPLQNSCGLKCLKATGLAVSSEQLSLLSGLHLL